MKTLLLGGVKSGKSRFAEKMASDSAKSVVVIATARADDEEMQGRIKRHQVTRPKGWRVIEEPMNLSAALSQALSHDDAAVPPDPPYVIVDCLTLWVTQLLCSDYSDKQIDNIIVECVETVRQFPVDLALVSNETNMGVVPTDALSRRYCDLIGRLHQSLAKEVDQVTLMVAGLPMNLK